MAIREIRVKIGERWYTVEVDEPLGSPARVTVEGETYMVEVEPPSTNRGPFSPSVSAIQPLQPLPSASAPSPSPSEGDVITSPMSGKVLVVRVKPGDRVAAGAEVCVVEAMKMEQSIRAHRDGAVKEVYVKPLDQVNIHAPLLELE